MTRPNIKTKRKVARSLIAYGKSMEEWVRPTEKSRRFQPLAANSFLLGVCLDRGISADRAWDAGQWIAESMGDEADPSALWQTLQSIEKRRLNGFMRYGYGGKAFHRHWKTFSDQLPKIAAIIIEKYRGDPRKLWNNQRDIEKVRNRFEELPGIGPALSRMAVLILVRNYGLLGGQEALAQLDIKPDVQVMRVFRRSGLVERENDLDGAIQRARSLSPDFPASLDAPAWEIGRTWCKPRRPKCGECPINSGCPRIL